jgi:hypothetical protein
MRTGYVLFGLLGAVMAVVGFANAGDSFGRGGGGLPGWLLGLIGIFVLGGCIYYIVRGDRANSS